MKKFLSILYMAVALLTVSCERPEMDSEVIEYGRPVNITLKYTTPRMAVQTRLAESEESKVNDLYVFLFDVTDEHKKVYGHYYSQEDLYDGTTVANHTAAGKIKLEGVPTGRYQIRAVANIQGGYMTENLMTQLNEVKNLENLNSLTAELTTPGVVDRLMPALFMSGVYNAGTGNDDHATPDEAVINGNGQLGGFIHLRRADSKIKFILKKANDQIKKFEPVSWQVFNVPAEVPVFEQEGTNNVTVSAYQTSSLKDRNAFNQQTLGQVSFEFYLPENKQAPKETITVVEDGKAYYERERKETDSDGVKSFKYAPQYATYVEICANMEIAMADKNDTYTRTAEVKYTVHLGYCKGKNLVQQANDWSNLRNTEYTYTIKVQGVDKIVLEATSKGEKEEQPGAEGIVMDPIGGEEVTVDAHYATFNIALTRADISNMQYLIRTPFGTYEGDPGTEVGRVGRLITDSKPFNGDEEDCTWIKFAATNDESTLVSYAETRDTKAEAKEEDKIWLMNVNELKNEYGNESAGISDENEELFFTVFVNENVYTQKSPIEYVNKEPRELTLFTSGSISDDGNSIYIKGKYKFRQRSIQSYYNGESDSMLGVEHSDETKGYNLTWSVTTPTRLQDTTWSEHDGWKNVAEGNSNKTFTGLVNRQWRELADLTMPDSKGYKTFQMKKSQTRIAGKQEEDSQSSEYYEILYACLSRNRDNDRDGVIDADELRWYLPAQDQYQQIFMGGVALEHPLFDTATITDNEYEGSSWRCQNKFHFASSDCRKLFAEQGCSTNNVFWSNDNPNDNKQTNSSKWARNIRCVRNLNMMSSGEGTDVSETGISKQPESPYKHDKEKRIISLDYYNESCLRSTFISGGGFLAAHDVFDYSKNSPYRKFQYAKETINITLNDSDAWKNNVAANAACKDYAEETDNSDRGTWRIPNQRELILIWMELNKIHANRTVLSASSDRFINSRYAGTGDVVQMPDIGGSYAIIPVRDIEE